MADFVLHDTLYQETLDVALTEVQELTDQIEHIRELLAQMEHRKKAVEDICDAIRRWAEVTADGKSRADGLSGLFSTYRENTVALTEEEVSRIAYPDGISKSPDSSNS